MPFFSKLKSKGSQPKSKGVVSNGQPVRPSRRHYDTSWASKEVVLEEVEELVHACTMEMKSRAEALDTPFLLLPFRPDSDSSGVRTFIASFFQSNMNGSTQYKGDSLKQELRLTDPIVLCCIMKWCWSRMPRGVVTWPVYEGFQIGEKESRMARNAFDTFIPIGAESTARTNIIFDFFDLIAAVAAHGKMNGLAGRKLSRLAGWWAFEHNDDGKGFEGGYKSWLSAADATSHLFFAYLRSMSPEANPAMSVIERIPRSLQALLASTEYPPETPTLLQRSTPRVVMLVDSVSPTPFALLRRAAHFEYRSQDRILREFQEFDDPVNALTEECKRVLYAIASTNASGGSRRPRTSGHVTQPEESWSAFQNMGFADLTDEANAPQTPNGNARNPSGQGLRSAPRSRNADFGRPTTPSWADFLSSGFADDETAKAPTLLLPPEKVLPPLGHNRSAAPSRLGAGDDDELAPGELAAITNVELDDAFWWVWITSLAGEEPNERKAAFGRCALVETSIGGAWLIMEEQVKGASPDPMAGAVLVEKTSRFSRFTTKGRINRKRSTGKQPVPSSDNDMQRTVSATPSKVSISTDQQAKIKAAARALADRSNSNNEDMANRRGRTEDVQSTKTNSVLTLGLGSEAGPAMKWANAYDKNAVRAMYLGDSFAGKGASREDLIRKASSNNLTADATDVASTNAAMLSPTLPTLARKGSNRDLPALPSEEATVVGGGSAPTNELPVPQKDSPPAEPLPVSPLVSPDEEKVNPVEQREIALPVMPDAMAKEVGMVDTPPHPQIGRKPVPSHIQGHPAFRPASADQSSTPSPVDNRPPAVIAAQAALTDSPESQKSNANSSKYKKPSSSGGLKKFFGRKTANANRQSTEIQRPSSNGFSSANDLGRRLSMMRNKKPANNYSPPVETAVPVQNSAQREQVVPASPVVSTQSPLEEESHVYAQEHEDPEHAFSTFDQGPMNDMPAAMPLSEEEEEEDHTPSQSQVYTYRPSGMEAPAHEDFATPMERVDDPTDDRQSEASIEPSPERDRWARIRENARNRAARASEEQSLQPTESIRTDEGETSGEETIESRVARIKARVAELTGNMNGAPPPVRT